MTIAPLKFSSHEIDQAKANADLVALVRDKVALRFRDGQWWGCCPFHKETTPSFQVHPGKQVFNCFGCGTGGDVIAWLQKTERLSFGEAVAKLGGAEVKPKGEFIAVREAEAEIAHEAEALRRKLEKARKIWEETQPAAGTPVARYLKSRGLGGMPIPDVLRYHPNLWHPFARRAYPGMVGGVLDDRGNLLGIHRTYLRPDGAGKIAGDQAKIQLGACHGGHLRLAEPLNGRIGVAEGIETALSVTKANPNLPCWAAMSLTNMGAPVPHWISEVVLCADNDCKQQDMADSLIEKAAKSLRRPDAAPPRAVRIEKAPPGMDFNDYLLKCQR